MPAPTANPAAHAAQLRNDQPVGEFPVQVLRGGGQPSDESRTLALNKPAQYDDCWIDVYEGPSGIGFVVNYEIVDGAETWQRALNFGGEHHRTHGWELVQPIV